MKYTTYETYRDKAKMNDYNVALKSKVSPQNISNWKKGIGLRIESQLKIAKTLKIPDKVVLHGD